MSASEDELVDPDLPETLPEYLEGLTKYSEPFLTDQEVEHLDAAAAALRTENQIQNSEYPLAERLLEIQKHAIILAAEVEPDTDLRNAIEDCHEDVERALLALSLDDREVEFDAE